MALFRYDLPVTRESAREWLAHLLHNLSAALLVAFWVLASLIAVGFVVGAIALYREWYYGEARKARKMNRDYEARRAKEAVVPNRWRGGQ